MTTDQLDPIETIRSYAPSSTDGAADAELQAVLRRVRTGMDASPAGRPTFRSRHRKITAFGAAAAIALAGVGVAAAAGVPVPDDVRQTFSTMFDYPSDRKTPIADPTTARRVFSIPGPENTTFEGWSATNARGGLCVTTTFEKPGDDGPPADINAGGGACTLEHADHGLFLQGSDNYLMPNRNDRVDFLYEAGSAVRAELRVSTGRTYPIAIQNGWMGGWYGIDTMPLGSTATIVAYGATGSVLGTQVAQTQEGCPTGNNC